MNKISENLSTEERCQFLEDLLRAVDQSKDQNSLNPIFECIERWEDIADLNSIKGLKERSWEKFCQLKEADCIR